MKLIMKSLKLVYNFFLNPSYDCIKIYRMASYLYNTNHKILALLFKNKLIKRYGVHIGLNARIGRNIKFPHPTNIVIGEGVVIGQNCWIYQGVTLGKKNGHLDNKSDYPKLGDNVSVFSGAQIIGSIKIGDNSIIAANSVVIKDVEANCIYGGIPAKRLCEITNESFQG